MRFLSEIKTDNIDINNSLIVREFTAGESISAGDICTINTALTDGEVYLADADLEGLASGIMLVALEAGTDSNPIKCGLCGIVGGFSGLVAGDIIYLSPTAGGITSTAPSSTNQIVRIIGYAVSTTEIFFNPDRSYIKI